MKILYNIAFAFLAICAFVLGLNMGVHSHIETKPFESEPFISPEELTVENNISSNSPDSFCVPVVPAINLDTETDFHLQQFRSRARKLNRDFPDAFFISGSHEEKKIALTFDDGPDRKATLKIIDILNEFGIKATFFIIGENAYKYPSIVKSLYDNGHQVANHSWSHNRPLSMDAEELLKEIDKTNAILNDILNFTDDYFHFFRPPYGLLTTEQLNVLKKHGHTAVCWSIDSMDWYTSSAEDIEKCVVKSAHPGAIVLLHSAGGKDQRSSTIEALPGIIKELSKQGYKFVTIEELLGRDN